MQLIFSRRRSLSTHEVSDEYHQSKDLYLHIW